MTTKHWLLLCGLILVLLMGLTQAAPGTAQAPGPGYLPTPMPHEPHSSPETPLRFGRFPWPLAEVVR